MSLFAHQAHAATMLTFLNDQSGFLSTIGAGTTVLTEDFSSAVNGTLVAGSTSTTPDTWNGFTVQVYGSGTSPWGASKYCTNLHAAGCINWNSQAPTIPGVYGGFAGSPELGLSFKPTSNTVAGISFDFSDWNDGGQRSQFIVFASDGTSVIVTGPTNAANAAPQNFGITLAPADIAAGKYITEVRWVGISGQSEIVGFYNFKTYTNPVITASPSALKPIPTVSSWALVILSCMCLGLFAHRRSKIS